VRQPASPFKTADQTARFVTAFTTLEANERKRALAKIELLIGNPAHPSLKTHPVKPDRYYWEAYLNKGDRIIYIPQGSHLVLVDIVAHDDIARYAKRPKAK